MPEKNTEVLLSFGPAALLNPIVLTVFLATGEDTLLVLLISAVASGFGIGVLTTAYALRRTNV